MTTDRRIEKLYPALAATERVVLLLEDRKYGRDDDPLIRSTMPYGQTKDFERMLRDAAIANNELGMLILALFEATRALTWRWRWFEAVVDHHNDLAALCADAGERDTLVPLQPPVDLDTPPSDETMAGRLPAVLKAMRDAAVGLADRAYATEQILEEFSGELDGADPLRPEARALLEETKERVAELLDALEPWVGPVAAPGDVSEELADLRRLVEAARRRR